MGLEQELEDIEETEELGDYDLARYNPEWEGAENEEENTINY